MVAKELNVITIEDISTDDIPEIAGIETASFSTPWSELSFYNEIKKPRSKGRAAKIEGRIVGYVFTSYIIDEGHILTLAVRPEFRRRGVAGELVRDAVEYLKGEGCRFIYLEVRVSNVEAKGLYEKFGFKSIGTRKDYYVSPVEDALVMVLKFAD